MRRTKKVAGKLRFCPENHQYCGDYTTNWDTGYKHIVAHDGIQVTESGVIMLTGSGDRDSDLRDAWRREFGIDVINTDTTNLPAKMYAPGTDRAIPKNALRQDKFLVDHETGRVLALNMRAGFDGYAKWLHPDAEAITDTMLLTRERNKAREASWMEEHKQDLLVGAGICALNTSYDNAHSYKAVGGFALLQKWMKGKTIIDPLDRPKYAHALAHLKSTPEWDEAFREATADFKEYHYLTLRPNQPQNVHLA